MSACSLKTGLGDLLAQLLSGGLIPGWLLVGITAVAALFVVMLLYAAVTGRLGLSPLVSRAEPLIPGTDGKHLYVLIHGWAGGPERMIHVKEAIRKEHPDADILMLRYPAHIFAKANPFLISEGVSNLLDDHLENSKRPTQRIILVGHSVGALLLRKALVYGTGRTEDLPRSEPTRPPRAWVSKVDRLVLLAGSNRGWRMEARPAGMKRLKRLWNKLGFWLARLTGTGDLILQSRAGEPFVSNLRVQWMDLYRRAGADSPTLPMVVQLIGDQDDVVSADDDKDVGVAKDFIFLRLEGTNHRTILDFKHPDYGEARRSQFLRALVRSPEKLADLKQKSEKPVWKVEPGVKQLVFVLHGIRDMAEWTSRFEAPLRRAYARRFPGESEDSIRVHPCEYGYFPMISFLVFGDRQKNVRWFMDEYTEVRAKYPNLERVDFIGHSNGTYILASALERYRTLKVNRVVFAGTVLRRDYAWEEKIQRGQVEQVKNFVASNDKVVGTFPAVFEAIGVGDLGSAGFNGFVTVPGKRHEVRFIKGGHSAALVDENREVIVDFIVSGDDRPVPGDLEAKKQDGAATFLHKACPFVWIMLILVLLGIIAGAGWGAWWMWGPSAGVVAGVGATLVLVAILNRV